MNDFERLPSETHEGSDRSELSRAEKMKTAFQSMENDAWLLSDKETASEGVPLQADDPMTINLEDKLFTYDPDKIEVAQPSPRELNEGTLEDCISLLQERGRDWTYLGMEENGYNAIFARPFFKELPNKLPPNAKFGIKTADFGVINTIEINDLEVDLEPLPLDLESYGYNQPVIDSLGVIDKGVMITIQRKGLQEKGRDSGGMKVEFMSRNHEIAKSSLASELRELLEILGSMGYASIVGKPSDERRGRIYEKMGMEKIEDSQLLMGDINTLITRE